MKLVCTILASVFLTFAFAKDPYPRNDAVDIQHYVFRLELNDSTNRISGEATIAILFKKSIIDFELDLIEQQASGFGMTVSVVQSESKTLAYTHVNGRLRISLSSPSNTGEMKTFIIRYAGVPEDGLVIGKNKYGDRAFFADNWPDRGHYWIPCVDHPSDKATVEFIIIAPEAYQVVATGKRAEEKSLPRKQKLSHYQERAPVAVKVMAIGVAQFAVEETIVGNITQSTWVYPQNRDDGFRDFAVGAKIFEYFQKNIGPFPYEKLAHVQSKTRWGGLENAGNIFYMEGSVTGKNEHEDLIAHETAHQWFGDGVTEDDWHHVWLSEGFATYFAALYLEGAYGKERLIEEMKKSQGQVIAHHSIEKRPIVDTTIVNIGNVLNTNTYQKASWVLHMLRQKIGDAAFWKGIRKYYADFMNKNAMTADFRKSMEIASGTDLKSFFNQWLYHGGHPQMSITWIFDKSTKKLDISVSQKQSQPFEFPLEVQFRFPDGTTKQQAFLIKGANEKFSLKTTGKPVEIVLDPSCKLLFEAELKEK